MTAFRSMTKAWMVLLAAACAYAQTAPAPTVGVLRPRVEAGVNHLMENVPPQYRAMVAAQMAAMQKQMSTQTPGIVARTWVEMLERKGIAAVVLDAETAEAGVKEAQAKGAGYLLASSVAADKKAGGPNSAAPLGAARGAMAISSGEQAATLSLAITYSVMDGAGHVLAPAKQAGCSGESRSESGSMSDIHLVQDVWADCGDRVVAAVAAVLPLGTVKYLDPESLLPHAPPMAESVRLDVTMNEQTLYKGKQLPGMDELQRDRKSIIEFAGGSISFEQHGEGMIYTPGANRLFLIDDKAHTYSTMTAEDLAFLRSFGRSVGARAAAEQGEAPKLIRAGADGSTVHYTVSDGRAGASDPSAATVEIEYGDPLPAWQHGFAEMQRLFAGIGTPPVRLGEFNDDLSRAVWAELAASPAPPRRVLMQSAMAAGRKKKAEMSRSTEILFDTSQTPRPVDFTIPRDYQWHTSPLLNMIWMQ